MSKKKKKMSETGYGNYTEWYISESWPSFWLITVWPIVITLASYEFKLGLWTQDYKTVAEAIATRALFGTMGIYKIERLLDLYSLNDAQRLLHNEVLV